MKLFRKTLSSNNFNSFFRHFHPFCVCCTWYLLSSSPIALPKWLQPLACSSSYSVLLFWLSGAFSSPQWKLVLNIYVQIKISLINNLNLLYFILKWTSIADRSRMREREWSTFRVSSFAHASEREDECRWWECMKFRWAGASKRMGRIIFGEFELGVIVDWTLCRADFLYSFHHSRSTAILWLISGTSERMWGPRKWTVKVVCLYLK